MEEQKTQLLLYLTIQNLKTSSKKNKKPLSVNLHNNFHFLINQLHNFQVDHHLFLEIKQSNQLHYLDRKNNNNHNNQNPKKFNKNHQHKNKNKNPLIH